MLKWLDGTWAFHLHLLFDDLMLPQIDQDIEMSDLINGILSDTENDNLTDNEPYKLDPN